MQLVEEAILGEPQMGFRPARATTNATWMFYNFIDWSITYNATFSFVLLTSRKPMTT
jgi:hypothetical protein